MPVLSVELSFDETGGWSYDGNPGSGTSEIVTIHTATMTPDTRTDELLQDIRLPQPGSPLPYNQFFTCVATEITERHPVFAKTRSTYSLARALDGNDPNDDGDNPLSRRALLKYSSINSEEQVDEDINGMPIATVNNEPYRVGKFFADQAITIEKNLPVWNPTNIDLFTNRVNSDTFLGFPPGQLRIDKIEATETEYAAAPGGSYFRASATLLSRRPINTSPERAWWRRRRHEGFQVRVQLPAPFFTTILNAIDSTGKPISKPVLLDEQGLEVTDPTMAFWQEWQVYETAAFNNLNLLP